MALELTNSEVLRLIEEIELLFVWFLIKLIKLLYYILVMEEDRQNTTAILMTSKNQGKRQGWYKMLDTKFLALVSEIGPTKWDMVSVQVPGRNGK